MKKLLYIIIVLLFISCDNTRVGYLDYKDALYKPNVMNVGVITDELLEGPNWISTPLQGVEGTSPIYITFESVETLDGDFEAFLKEVEIRGDGTFDVPYHHSIPNGAYKISLKLKNEGYSVILKDIFTIIIEK